MAFDIDIDSGTILYALGVVFAALATLYFLRDVVFRLSVTVKALLLLFGFVAFFVAGVAIQRDVLDTVAFALSVVSYVAFVAYVIGRHNPGETGVFLLFTLSAGLFIGLGYGLRERGLSVSTRTAGYVVLGLAVASAVLVSADALGGGVSHELEVDDSVTFTAPASEDARRSENLKRTVATVTATNGFVFRRPVALPEIETCVAGDQRLPADVEVDYKNHWQLSSDTIAGSGTETYDVVATIYWEENASQETTLAVERGTDCETRRAQPTLLVSFGDDTL